MNFTTKDILNVPIANIHLSQIVPLIASLIESYGKKTFFGVNAYNLNLALTDQKYRVILQKASVVYPEGYGVVLAAKILGKPLFEKTTLMDFIYNLLEVAERNSWAIYLLGGGEGVAKKAAENLKLRYKKLAVAGFHSGYFKKNTEKQLIKQINRAGPTILFVAMGTPRQEKWITDNLNGLDAKAFFGIGGAIDIISKIKPRAPAFLHEARLEWLFRFFLEPRRLWKRYLIDNMLFLARVLREAIIIRSKNAYEQLFS